MSDRASKSPGPSVITVYGLKNCDATRKAAKWLQQRGVPTTIHDVRDDRLSRPLLESWLATGFAEQLLNRRSTTWRDLSGSQRAAALENPAKALLKHPTLLKRPVIVAGEEVLGVGFRPEELEAQIRS